MLAFPGGAGYGNPAERDVELVKRDLLYGYISAQTASEDYGLSDKIIAEVADAAREGKTL
jgi:N-methylhydantoinase B